ncbi:type III pantothenate kinase [Marinobacter caseinilyticus]|uniref:type III pantothenate kinase n=1 Tax=Marinobacter caseinilyticus TaxID=2692195 RepID=UPI00140DB9C8|nr:type III pantothenate kinase [Marinobacter caseinilyticus]
MRLLVDAGNSRVKWRLLSASGIERDGQGDLFDAALFAKAKDLGSQILRVAVSTVRSESDRDFLVGRLAELTAAPARFYWTEGERGGLHCAYGAPNTMGADRWHALYGVWAHRRRPFVIIDAGSAITIDFVADNGRHLGGYILSGRSMLLRSLRQDAARIHFDEQNGNTTSPGTTTTECVQHGLGWLWQGMIERLEKDCRRLSITDVFVTGGDATELLALGLNATPVEGAVLTGLDLIDRESHR